MVERELGVWVQYTRSALKRIAGRGNYAADVTSEIKATLDKGM